MKLSEQVTEPFMMASFLMNDISRICRQLVDEHMRSLDLTRAQWYLLNYVYLYDGLSQQELADLIDLGKSNVAKQIHRLELKGWVRRGPHEADGRSFRVYLSPEVKPTIKKLNSIASICLKNLLDGFSKTESTQLIGMLRRIDGRLEEELASNMSRPGIKKLLDDIRVGLKDR